MLTLWVGLSAAMLLTCQAQHECGPNVVPLSTVPGKPCRLRVTRDDLAASDSELAEAVHQGLERGGRLAARLREREAAAAQRQRVAQGSPEYHHYLTNVASDGQRARMADTLRDLADASALSRQLSRQFNIHPDSMGDLLTSIKVPADPSHVLQTPRCNASSIYRTHNGSCNNLEHPMWGMLDTPYSRLMQPVFHDGINEPRKSVTGKELPNARSLRQHLLPVGDFDDETNTMMVMGFGGLITHDGALSGDWLGENGQYIMCCSHKATPLPCKDISVGCYPVKIPEDDEFYTEKGVKCMSVVRTMKTYTMGGYLGPAQSVSSASHYLDASFMYGSDERHASRIREFSEGRLTTRVLADGRKVLPQVNDSVASCSVSSDETCFLAGDDRVNQNPLVALETILFVREHNRVADQLSAMNPHWDDERLYQETRRIVIAEYQHIAYTDFLPRLIREDWLAKYNITSRETGFSYCYNASTNPATLAEFTEAVYRMFHGIVQGKMRLYKGIGCPFRSQKITNWLDRPEIITQGDHLDQIALGMAQQPTAKDDKYTDYELDRNLFKGDGEYGQDLSTFDILRGRDSGLGSYNDYRELIGLSRAEKFEDFSDLMPYEDATALGHFYEHPDDVDLIMVMLDKRNENTLNVRETILVEQFKRWKCGDRFFYDYGGSPYPFTSDQINEIKKATISRIVCDNSDHVTRIPHNSFKKVSNTNKVVDCNELPVVDLSFWKENK
ncbi:peroxidase-like [Schistocerca cancellata]|uniref:peroxidase-like n=1 Tax=Schistocerca cancellata TaxID=274614 RepID=UPI0021190AFD|nr:peroxidase-like [Schistocerca cancellata]